jgi:hypothetical protein
MPSIRIQNMGGISPRLSDRLIPQSAATIAQNCKLGSGEIRPYHSPRLDSAPVKTGLVESIHNINGFWLSWNSDVDVVRGFVPNDTTGRFYYTGDGKPKVSNISLATASQPYPTNGYDLGVPAPTARLTATLGAGGAGVAVPVVYLYTYVTVFEEESAPSPPSVAINVPPGATVQLTTLLASTRPNVNRIRIYRTSVGSTTTEYLFVKEIPSNQTTFTDNVREIDLKERLLSTDWLPPPDNMVGVISHPNNFIAGFVGNQLLLSEQNQLHAFPARYVRSFDFPIVALGIYGSTIVVATTGFIYLVSGTDPRAMSVERLPDPYPCVSKRSLVSADRGVIFASNEGLVWVGYGGLEIITRDVLARDDWQKYNPSSMHGISYDGRYIGFYLTDGGRDYTLFDPVGQGFIFDYNDRATGVDQKDKLTTLDFYPTAAYANPDTNFYFVERKDRKNRLYEWEAGSTFLKYVWRSKAFLMAYLINFGAAKVVCRRPTIGRTVKITIYVGSKAVFTRFVTTNEPFRLSRFYRAVEPWYVEVTGDEDTQEIHLATSVEELKEGKAQ